MALGSVSLNMVWNPAIKGSNFLQASVKGIHTYAQKVTKANLLQATKFPLLNRNIKQLDNHLGRIRSQTAKISANPIRLDVQTSRTSLKEARKDITAIEHDAKQFAFWTKKANENLNKPVKEFPYKKIIQKPIQKSTQKAQIGTGAMVGAVGAVGIMTLPFKASIDFESNMADVKALTKNITAEDFTLLTAKAKKLGSTTEWSASQSAIGMTYLAKAGFNAKQQLGAMGGVLGLATAGSVDLGTASDISSNILSSFSIKAEKMGMVSDVLAKTFSTSNTDLLMLGETMKYTAPIASGLGVGLSEVSALAGKLGDVGIQGSMAGTSLRQMYTRLSAPPTEARDALNALGVSVFDAKGKFKGMPNVIGELNASMVGLTDEQKVKKLKPIFGMTAISAGVALLKVGRKGLLEYQATLDASGGTTKKIQTIKLDTTKGHFKLLASAMEGLSISATTNLLPTIKMVSNTLKSGAEKLDAFTQKFPNASKWIFGLGTAFIVGSVALAGFGFIASGVGASLALLASPVAGVVLGVMALAGAGVYLYNKFEFIKLGIDNLFSGIMTAVSPTITNLKNSFGGLFSSIGGLFASISPLFSLVGSALNYVGINASSVGGLIGSAFGLVLTPIIWVVQALTWVIDMGAMVANGWTKIGTVAGIAWTLTVNRIKSPFVSLFSWLEAKFQSVMGFVNKVKNIASSATDMSSKVKEKASNYWSETKNFFGFKKESLKASVPANNLEYKKNKSFIAPLSETRVPTVPIESVSAVTSNKIEETKTQNNANNAKNIIQNINNHITVKSENGIIDEEDLYEKLKRVNKRIADEEQDLQMQDIA